MCVHFGAKIFTTIIMTHQTGKCKYFWNAMKQMKCFGNSINWLG